MVQHNTYATRMVQFPIDEVWPLIANLGEVYKFHPMVDVVEVEQDTNARSGLGAHRILHFRDGTSLWEEVIVLDDIHLRKRS